MNELLIMRHGQAPWGSVDDFHRSLSDHGHAQAAAAAIWLAGNDCVPDALFASPLLRAQQTATPVAEAFGFELGQHDFLTPDCRPEQVIRALAGVSAKRVLLVSHQPLVGVLFGWLCNERPAPFDTASIALLRADVWAEGSAEKAWLRHSNDYDQRF